METLIKYKDFKSLKKSVASSNLKTVNKPTSQQQLEIQLFLTSLSKKPQVKKS